MTSPIPSPEPLRAAHRFMTTRWSLIQQAAQRNEAPARAALEELCQAYWLPVYAFMRRQTRDVHEAQDWTQSLFLSLLGKAAFADLSPDQGRFRSFLLAAARHFVCNEYDRKKAIVRGGKLTFTSLDFEDGERQLASDLSREMSAESLFERQWAIAILERVLSQLRAEHGRAGQLLLFEELAKHLSGQTADESLAEVARSFEMTAEAIRVALHRLRKRYRSLLRKEIAQTMTSLDDIEDEIKHLFRALIHH